MLLLVKYFFSYFSNDFCLFSHTRLFFLREKKNKNTQRLIAFFLTSISVFAFSLQPYNVAWFAPNLKPQSMYLSFIRRRQENEKKSIRTYVIYNVRQEVLLKITISVNQIGKSQYLDIFSVVILSFFTKSFYTKQYKWLRSSSYQKFIYFWKRKSFLLTNELRLNIYMVQWGSIMFNHL